MAEEKRISKICLNCKKEFSIPRCRDWREHCCSSACKTSFRKAKTEAAKKSRVRTCFDCGSAFYPRQNQIDNGQGKYCSNKCQIKSLVAAGHTEQANKRRADAVRLAVKEGRHVAKAGADNPNWRGGKEEAKKRRRESGKETIWRRAYRKNNPDKVREFAQTRRGKFITRLPRGTVPKLRVLQKNRCAICRIKLDDSYHLDHIMPLARGGEHHPDNLQLLCGTCNVRKSAKDPIKYMQERGMLL